VKKNRLALIETEMRVTAAITAAVIGTWDWHVQANRVYADERFAQAFGVEPAAAARGAPVELFISGIHEKDRERVRKQIVAAVASGDLFAEEYRVVAADGTIRWVLARGRCLRVAGKPVRFPGAVTDITDRKQREHIQDLCAAEMHHRFRNLMTVIQTIAVATLKDDVPVRVAREAFLDRLAATGVALRVLTTPSGHSANLEDLLRAALGGMIDRARVRIQGRDIAVGATQALAVTLAIHELATNAMKYGALSFPSGLIDLKWMLDTDTGIFMIEWIETGGPIVVPPSREGFGTLLIRQNVESELRAKVRSITHRQG
jgi:PAS domain S-box-containing protein